MHINNIKLSLSIVLIIVSTMVFGFEVPKLNARVNDNAHMFSARTVSALEDVLAQLETQTSIQVAILTINSVKESSLESASIQTANTWALGQHGKDNGLLIFIAKQDRKIRIEVGAGLESTITDAAAGRIIDNIMRPNFINEHFDGGIIEAVNEIIDLTGAKDISSIRSVDDAFKFSEQEYADISKTIFTRVMLYVIFLSAMLVIAHYSNRPLKRHEDIIKSTITEPPASLKPLDAYSFLPVYDDSEVNRVNTENSGSVTTNNVSRSVRNAKMRANLLAGTHALIFPFFMFDYWFCLTEGIFIYLMFMVFGYFLGMILFMNYKQKYSLFSSTNYYGLRSSGGGRSSGGFSGGGGGFRGGGSSGGW